MFKAPHDNPYLLFAHSTSTCPTNPTPSTLPICQRHPNTLSTSSSSARAGHHFLCAVTVLSRRVGGFRFLLVSPPSTAPGLRHPPCSVLCDSLQAGRLWAPVKHRQRRPGCTTTTHITHLHAKGLSPPLSLPSQASLTAPLHHASQQLGWRANRNSRHSAIKKFKRFKMSQNCYPHILEQKYQLPRLAHRPSITCCIPPLGSPDRTPVSLVSQNHRKLCFIGFQ